MFDEEWAPLSMIVLPLISSASRACGARTLRLNTASAALSRCALPVTRQKPLSHGLRSISWTAVARQQGNGTTGISSPEPVKTWVDRVPPKIKPYLLLARMEKPIGTLLLFYPCGVYSGS